jgi:hypothetical protein
LITNPKYIDLNTFLAKRHELRISRLKNCRNIKKQIYFNLASNKRYQQTRRSTIINMANDSDRNGGEYEGHDFKSLRNIHSSSSNGNEHGNDYRNSATMRVRLKSK